MSVEFMRRCLSTAASIMSEEYVMDAETVEAIRSYWGDQDQSNEAYRADYKSFTEFLYQLDSRYKNNSSCDSDECSRAPKRSFCETLVDMVKRLKD
jgi:hypothetical protein